MDYLIRQDGTVWRKGTLAHALDTRRISFGEPTAEDLPKTLNPLELIHEIMGAHLIVVHLPDTAVQKDLTYCLPLLKLLTPPGSAPVIVKDLPAFTDTCKISASETSGTAQAVRFTTSYKGVRD